MSESLLYVGCYTKEMGGKGQGVAAVGVDRRTGALTPLGVVAPAASPSFLARHPRLPVLYAVNELDDGEVSAWAVESPLEPRPLGARPTGGAHPCHVAVHPGGGHLVVTNYTGGSVAVHPLDGAGRVGERTDLRAHEGSGPNRDRQEGAHPHMAHFIGTADQMTQAGTGDHMARPGRSDDLLVTDLGCDAVFRYRLDGRTGRLEQAADPVRLPPGTGPRHLAISPSGRWYVAGELAGTLTVVGPDGPDPDPVPTSDRPGERAPSEIALSADGRFAYVANRGPDTVSVFDVSGDRPRPVAEVPTGGDWPRHFAISGDLMFVANERSHALVGFRIDAETGIPRPTGHTAEIASPACVFPITTT
jgi:6-phosphogluconolactonase (cycloisomerase 2 family)